MKERNLFSVTSDKSIREFIKSLRKNAPRFNFNIRNVFNMKEEYKKNNVDVKDDFQLYQITVCSFKRSYLSMQKNIERAAVLLQPKQIIAFVKEGKTTINYLPFTKEFIKEALPKDREFQGGLFESCHRIAKLIEMSK